MDSQNIDKRNRLFDRLKLINYMYRKSFMCLFLCGKMFTHFKGNLLDASTFCKRDMQKLSDSLDATLLGPFN